MQDSSRPCKGSGCLLKWSGSFFAQNETCGWALRRSARVVVLHFIAPITMAFTCIGQMYPAWNDIRADQRQRPVC